MLKKDKPETQQNPFLSKQLLSVTKESEIDTNSEVALPPIAQDSVGGQQYQTDHTKQVWLEKKLFPELGERLRGETLKRWVTHVQQNVKISGTGRGKERERERRGGGGGGEGEGEIRLFAQEQQRDKFFAREWHNAAWDDGNKVNNVILPSQKRVKRKDTFEHHT